MIHVFNIFKALNNINSGIDVAIITTKVMASTIEIQPNS